MLKKFSFLILIVLFISIGTISAQDKVTEIKLNVFPETAKIRPLETAVIQAEFYGKKKKGLFGGLFGDADDGTSRVQSNDWKVVLTKENSGWLSKPFLFQKEGEKTKSGFENFIKQGLGAASAKDSILFTAPNKTGKYTIKINEGSLSKEVTIEVSNSAPSSNKTEVYSFSSEPKSADPRFYLAEHYAPFIAQETWFNPKADYLARFDYDKNWKGDDNWENLEKGSSQAFVYYAVMETKTHWFLIYNFFHPRDYSDICIVGTCHENDNEGLILTVRKDGSKFGKLEVMETLAHNNVYSFTNDSKIKKGIHNIDGKIDLYEGVRPIIFIEAGGHGVLASSHKTSFFSSEKMDFIQNTGVTYVYKNVAEKPKNSNDRNVGYALLPIYEEWWSRGNQATADLNETFDNFYTYEPFGNRPKASAKFIAGAFKGRTASNNMAKPFWAWHDNRTRKKKVLSTGQWALDPAYSISVNLSFPSDKPVSTEYIFNPYLEIESNKISRK
jgi:hypothetical protein